MQSIIVYRNPLEAAMWESVMSGDAMVLSFVTFLVLAPLMAMVADKVRKFFSKKLEP